MPQGKHAFDRPEEFEGLIERRDFSHLFQRTQLLLVEFHKLPADAVAQHADVSRKVLSIAGWKLRRRKPS